MTLPIPPDPSSTDPSTQAGFNTWFINLYYNQIQNDATAQAQNLDATNREIAALEANTAAMNRQADAITAAAAAQSAIVEALNSFSDAELMARFTEALITDWGAASRGAASIVPTAKQMVVEYRKLYPAPAP